MKANPKNQMKTTIVTSAFICALATLNGGAQNPSTIDRKVGGPCEDCEIMLEGMPQTMNWESKISGIDEPGDPMEITGTIFKPDGKTPAPNVILYIYHTDAKGIYSPSPGQKHGNRHGHLRGWIKTDAQGRYKFVSIRPASYPNGQAPQHIHPIIKEAGMSPYWIDEYLFNDDPFLTEEEKMRQKKRGGSGIIRLTKNEQGVWVGRRDIVLGMNIPGYSK
jgi:protocatechuate 3,4-dioxygenase, beta subunit